MIVGWTLRSPLGDSPLFQTATKGEQGQIHQLEVLLGKGNADDGDGEEHAPEQVIERDRPAKNHNPHQIQNQDQRGISIRPFLNRATKRRERSDANLNRRQAKGNANDGQTSANATENVAHPTQKAAKNQPDNIA